MPHTWETLPSGIVVVDGTAPTLAGPGKNTRRTDYWAPLASRWAKKRGVPLSWVLAIIRSESAGFPDAKSGVGAIGLMQVVPKWHNITAAELLDPERNIRKGTDILRRLRALGLDLPRTASSYNAGMATDPLRPHPSTSSPWGIREQPGYISGVVAGQNWYNKRLADGDVPLSHPGNPLLGGLLALTFGGVAWTLSTRF